MKIFDLSSMLRNVIFSSISVFTTFSYAASENPLVIQAKELQTGSERVNINVPKAIELLKQASNQGDAEAKTLLAHYYFFGSTYQYLPANSAIRQKLLTEAAEKGNYEAYHSLKLEHDVGQAFGVDTNMQKELNRIGVAIRKKAESGDAESMQTMYLVLDDGTNNLNIEQCRWLYKAYQKGNWEDTGRTLQDCDETILMKISAPKLEKLQQQFEAKKNEKNQTLKQQSKQGNILAKIALANDSDESNISQKERSQLNKDITQFYKDQAAKGAPDAYLVLAEREQNSVTKMDFLKKAADLNYAVALTQLGADSLFEENASPKKIESALKYLNKAAQLKDPTAMNYLGVWYTSDENADANVDTAIQYFQQAADLGSVDALANMARMSDELQNYQWAVRAYQQGNVSDDILEYALIAYKEGKGTAKNPSEAKKIEETISRKNENSENLEDLFKE